MSNSKMEVENCSFFFFFFKGTAISALSLHWFWGAGLCWKRCGVQNACFLSLCQWWIEHQRDCWCPAARVHRTAASTANQIPRSSYLICVCLYMKTFVNDECLN